MSYMTSTATTSADDIQYPPIVDSEGSMLYVLPDGYDDEGFSKYRLVITGNGDAAIRLTTYGDASMQALSTAFVRATLA